METHRVCITAKSGSKPRFSISSQTLTDDDDFPNLCSSTTTPPLTPNLKFSEPESSPYSISDDEISYLGPGQSIISSSPHYKMHIQNQNTLFEEVLLLEALSYF
jgi:hypothetical protein